MNKPEVNASRFYADAFALESRDALSDAMAEWGHLSESDRSFIQTHLLFLQVQGMASLRRRIIRLERHILAIAEDLMDEREDDGSSEGTDRVSAEEAVSTELDESGAVELEDDTEEVERRE